MPSGQAIKAGEAFLELTVRDKNFASGLQKSLGKLQQVGKSVALIGAGISALGATLTAPFVASIKIFSDLGSSLDFMSKRTGVSVEALSLLGFEASETGADISDLETSLKKMSKVLVAAKEGNKEAGQAFHELGLSFKDVENKNPADQLITFLTALNKITDASTKSGLALKVFGRSGTALLPLAASAEKLRDEFEHFNLDISGAAAGRATALRQSFGLLSAVIKRLGFEVGDALSDKLGNVLTRISEVTASAIKWASANHGLVVTLALAAGSIAIIGTAVTGFAVSATIGSIALSTIVGIIGTAIAPFTSLAGVAAISAAALVAFGIKASGVSKFLAQRFGELSVVISETFTAIADALKGGDIVAAANVLWSGLKVVWLQGTQELRDIWIELKDSFLRVGLDIVFGLEREFTSMKSAILKIFTELKASVQGLALDIGGFFNGLFASDKEKKAIADINALAKQGIEGNKQAELDAIDAQKKAQIGVIDATSKAATEDRDRAFNSQLDQARKQLAEARRSFETAKTTKGFKGFKGGELADVLGATVGGVGDFAASIGARSTFNGKLAPQIFGSGKDDVPRNILLEAKKQTRLLQEIKAKPAGGLNVGST